MDGRSGLYPEYKQWTFYHTTRADLLAQGRQRLANRPWDATDEYFHLKRFLTYYGPYDRSIDPAVNLGPFENKYSLHSRLMHYFVPPVQSAVSIMQRNTILGKRQTLQIGCELFPTASVFAEIIDVVDRHYETADLYREPALTELENHLFDSLKLVASRLASFITIISDARTVAPERWKDFLAGISISPRSVLFDHVKFARLMKGRLRFYANAPSHFDSKWCIANELRRIGKNFFRVPFRLFGELTTGKCVDDPANVVRTLAGNLLTEQEVRATLAFNRLTPGMWHPGQEVDLAHQIADVFDDFFRALYKISRAVTVYGATVNIHGDMGNSDGAG